MKKSWMIIGCLLFALLAVAAILITKPVIKDMRAETTKLELVDYIYSSQRLPDEFSGFRIAQIADLHNTEFGSGNQQLLQALAESEPDMIVFTGDTIDSGQLDLDVAINFAAGAVKIAPCYFVNGNHEASIIERVYFHEQLRGLGVVVLEDEKLLLEHEGAQITLFGLDHPSLSSDYFNLGFNGVIEKVLSELNEDTQGFTLLLAHHPECINIYADKQIDLVLSGHTHGGQIRLKRLGALVAPGQGLFPKYDRGVFREDNTTLIISSGLGNSKVPLRYNNPPELVLIELNKGEAQ